MFTMNLCQRYPEERLDDLRRYMAGGARFWVERGYGEAMIRTAGPERMRHLAQVLANGGQLAAPARLAGAAVDGEDVFGAGLAEVAQLAAGLALDGPLEVRGRGGGDAGQFDLVEIAGRGVGRNAGAVEDLDGADVAQAADPALVHQER